MLISPHSATHRVHYTIVLHLVTFSLEIKTPVCVFQVGSWFTFVFWLIVTACFAFRLRMLNAEEDFLTTLNRERDRLTSGNRAQQTAGPDYDQI